MFGNLDVSNATKYLVKAVFKHFNAEMLKIKTLTHTK